LYKRGCHGNSLGSLDISDIIFEFADPENLTIRGTKYWIFCAELKLVLFCLFLPKFGCRGNSFGSLEISFSIFEFAEPENLTTRVKNYSILRRTVIGAIFVYFCLKLVAMATTLSPLKIKIDSPTPKTLLFVWKCPRFFCAELKSVQFLLIFAQIMLPW